MLLLNIWPNLFLLVRSGFLPPSSFFFLLLSLLIQNHRQRTEITEWWLCQSPSLAGHKAPFLSRDFFVVSTGASKIIFQSLGRLTPRILTTKEAAFYPLIASQHARFWIHATPRLMILLKKWFMRYLTRDNSQTSRSVKQTKHFSSFTPVCIRPDKLLTPLDIQR